LEYRRFDILTRREDDKRGTRKSALSKTHTHKTAKIHKKARHVQVSARASDLSLSLSLSFALLALRVRDGNILI